VDVKRILVVSSIRPPATALDLIDSLREAGREVRVVSDWAHAGADPVAAGAFDAAGWADREGFRPDALLFIEGGTRLIFPRGMENLDCVTAWYALDPHLHLRQHLHVARLFDVTFVAHLQFISHFRDGDVQWLPAAVNPRVFAPTQDPRDIDVAHIGSENRELHPERVRLLDLIRSRYRNTFIGRADLSRIGEIYGRAKVVFNHSVRSEVNIRYFEAMGAGAVLVTDRAPRETGVEQLFSPGEDFLEYHDDASLLSAIDSVLGDEQKRERMGSRAQRLVLANHTYRHRAETILKVLSKTQHRVRPGPEDYLPAYHLLHYPDAVLLEASRSMKALRSRGDRNPILALVVPLLSGLARLLGWAYRLRYRLRHARLARKNTARSREHQR
jgi:hypothetical protein